MGLIRIEEFKTAMTSLEVAELVGKRHADVMRDIRLEISEIGEENGLSIFAQSYYINSQNKEQPMYNLNELGCRQMGMRWSAKDRFTINIALDKKNKPLSELDLIIQSAQALKLVTDRLEDTENKVELLDKKFDSVVTLESGKQRNIQKAIACRVYERANALDFTSEVPYYKNSKCGFKKLKSKLFSGIHRELKNKFGVSSYKDIKVVDYELALNFISNWIESYEVREV